MENNNKKILVIFLLLLTVVLGGGAIFISSRLSGTPSTAPQQTSAYACPVLSNYLGSCQMPPNQCAGPICMKGVLFTLYSTSQCYPGQMMNCLSTGPACSSSDCGPCLPSCSSDEDVVSPVGNACPAGSHVTKGTCSGCDNPYWGCCQPKIVTNTPTPTPTYTYTPTVTNTFTPPITNTFTPTITNTFTPTITNTFTPTITNTFTPTITETPTNTPTGTITITITPTTTFTPTISSTFTPTTTRTITPSITNTITPTTTLPPTALISDEIDRIILGFILITAGLVFYKLKFGLLFTPYLLKKFNSKKIFEINVENEYD